MWVTGIMAFLQALPKLLGLLERFGTAWKTHNMDQWLESLDTATKDFENAKNQKDRIEALKRLADSSRNIPNK